MDYLKTLTPWPFVPVLIASIGLGLTIFQLRKLVQSIQGQTYQRIYELMIDIDRFFIDNPKLKEHFYPNLPKKKPDGEAAPERGKIAKINTKAVVKHKNHYDANSEEDGKNLYSVAEMIIDYFDNVYHQRKSMPRGTFRPFSNFMRKTYEGNPLLKQFIKDNHKWYPPEFIRHLAGGKTRREQLGDSIEGLKARVRR